MNPKLDAQIRMSSMHSATIMKMIVLSGLFLIFTARTSEAVEIAESGYGIGFPVGIFYSGTRGPYGSAGLILGRSVTKEQDLLGYSESVDGLLVDGTIGRNDFSYSVGYGGGTPIGLIGGAIRATALIGRPSEQGYFLERNQKSYGIELSAALGFGFRLGVFRTQNTHITKVITSVGFGF